MIKFRLDPLNGLVDKLDKLAARARFAVAAVEAVNLVTKRADGSLRRGEIRDINLSPEYVKSKTDVRLADSGGAPRAEIVTKGTPTILGRFAPLVRLLDPNRRDSIGRRLGGRSAGTSLRIRQTKPESQKQWFILRLRSGNAAGDNYGVFVRDNRLPARNGPNAALAGGRHRDGKAGKRHIYGPAPYQLFKQQILLQSDDIQADLAKTALQRMGDVIEEDLG